MIFLRKLLDAIVTIPLLGIGIGALCAIAIIVTIELCGLMR